MGEWIALAGACAVIGPVLLGPGCSSGSGTNAEPPNAGLEALAADSAGRPIVRTDDLKPVESTSDLNLSEVFDRAPVTPRTAVAPPQNPPAAEPVAIEHIPPAPATPAPPTEDTQHKVQRLADELRVALADRAGPRPTFHDAAAGVALDGVAPDTAGRALGTDLPPGQRRVLDAMRTIVKALTEGGASSGDPRTAVGVLNAAAASLDDSKSVQIRRTALCSKVSGFGRYQEIGSLGFVAGRPIRFIVYTELDRFGHRAARANDPGMADFGAPADGKDVLAVEVSQELALWHDADGSAQWRQSEQTVVEVSRNRRGDFYLVQQVELPPNLSVGKYNLKVSVRDRTSGAQDEAQIPITLVADPSLTLAPGGR